MLRTFVAVEIGQDVRARAAALIKQLRATSANIKWVEPVNMHFTMKFLGEVDFREVPAICAAVSKAVEDMPPFEIEVRGAGAFPSPANPRTIWLGVGRGDTAMITLHGAIEEALAGMGFRIDGRRFRPHLTIGRVRSSPTGIDQLAKLIDLQSDFDAGPTIVEDVAIFSSDLNPGGPTYEALGHAELRGSIEET